MDFQERGKFGKIAGGNNRSEDGRVKLRNKRNGKRRIIYLAVKYERRPCLRFA